MNDKIDSYCEKLEKYAVNIWENRRNPLNMLIIFSSIFVFLVLVSFIINPLVITSAALAFFAYFTVDANWQNVKLNLFDRRLDLYNMIHNELDKYSFRSEEFHNWDTLEVFIGEKRRETRFLFDKNIDKFISELQSNVTRLIQITESNQELREESRGVSQSSERYKEIQDNLTSNVQKQEELRDNLIKLRSNMVNIFSPYLDFQHIK